MQKIRYAHHRSVIEPANYDRIAKQFNLKI